MAEVEIEYCVPCGLLPAAEEATHAILTAFGRQIGGVRLVPSQGGVFKIRVGGDEVFDKARDRYDLDDIVRRIGAHAPGLALG